MNPTVTTAEILLGLGVAALGAFIAVETSEITVAPIYAKVGPTVIPYIVAGASDRCSGCCSPSGMARETRSPRRTASPDGRSRRRHRRRPATGARSP